MTTTTITLVSEDTPFEMYVLTGDDGKAVWTARREAGALFFCDVCEIDREKLLERGLAYEPDTGSLWCLHCFFDPINNWQFIARGHVANELTVTEEGKHRASL